MDNKRQGDEEQTKEYLISEIVEVLTYADIKRVKFYHRFILKSQKEVD